MTGEHAIRWRTVLEPIEPEASSFDARTMARGEPGVPRRFTWRGTPYEVAEVGETWRTTGPEKGRGVERYVRRHGYVITTTDGRRMRLAAERRVRRGTPRWLLHSIEVEGPSPP